MCPATDTSRYSSTIRHYCSWMLLLRNLLLSNRRRFELAHTDQCKDMEQGNQRVWRNENSGYSETEQQTRHTTSETRNFTGTWTANCWRVVETFLRGTEEGVKIGPYETDAKRGQKRNVCQNLLVRNTCFSILNNSFNFPQLITEYGMFWYVVNSVINTISLREIYTLKSFL